MLIAVERQPSARRKEKQKRLKTVLAILKCTAKQRNGCAMYACKARQAGLQYYAMMLPLASVCLAAIRSPMLCKQCQRELPLRDALNSLALGKAFQPLLDCGVDGVGVVRNLVIAMAARHRQYSSETAALCMHAPCCCVFVMICICCMHPRINATVDRCFINRGKNMCLPLSFKLMLLLRQCYGFCFLQLE